MEQIHLSVDGARIGKAEERATCTVCEKELHDGEDVAVHIHFDEFWRVNWNFCIDCLDGMLESRFPDKIEEAIVHGRVISRYDEETGSATPAIRTRGGDGGVFRHKESGEEEFHIGD